MAKQTVFVGDVFKTGDGGSCTVIEYKGWADVLVRFNDDHGHIGSFRAEHLRTGRVNNPFHRSCFGVGYHGVGEYSAITHKAAYDKWRGMLHRCYDESFKAKSPWYAECTVISDWHNFQNFAKWIVVQKNYDRKGFELDKDIIKPGNKQYGPKTCSVVPVRINRLTTVRNIGNGLPAGVFQNKRGNYYAYCSDARGKRANLGTHNNLLDAKLAYKSFKERVVKEMADIYRDDISEETYTALMSYEVAA